MEVAVCALTYKRPEGLARLLDGLDKLVFRDAAPRLRIVIVDNDPEGSAREVCERLAENVRWPLEYVAEPQRGIARARNTALDNRRDADYVCFIDDDEVPEPRWLDELIRLQEECDADVVTGPVLSRLPQNVPAWIERGRFFERRRYATGERLTHTYTGNALIRASAITPRMRFDERLSFTGGEDRHFFQRLTQAGGKIVWADDAVVTEWVPDSRTNADWLIRRHYRVGCATSIIELDLRPKWRVGPLLLAKSAVWLAIGVGLTAAGLVAGKHLRVKGRRACAYGAGLLAGLFGVSYEE